MRVTNGIALAYVNGLAHGTLLCALGLGFMFYGRTFLGLLSHELVWFTARLPSWPF